MTAPWAADVGKSTHITLRVQPRASRTEIVGLHGDALRVRLSAAPVDGAANRELIKFVAKKLRRPPSGVTLVRGDRGRTKTLSVEDMDSREVVSLLWPGEG